MNKPRTILLYGKSRCGKTTALCMFAKWLWNTHNLKSRLVAGDPGGYQQFIDEGLVSDPPQAGDAVEVFDFSARELALADLRRISRGYWPRRTKEGKEYFKTDPVCMTTDEKWGQIGAYLVEGFTSLGDVLLFHASKQSGGLGFKDTWTFTEDGETVTGLQQGHWNIVQKELYERHSQDFSRLPIKYLVWTAQEGTGTWKGSAEYGIERGSTVFAPLMVGSAVNPKIPSWFVDCFHISREVVKTVDDKEVEAYLAWIKTHRDPETGFPFLCGHRLGPALSQKVAEKYKKGFIHLTLEGGIEKYYKFLEEVRNGTNTKV